MNVKVIHLSSFDKSVELVLISLSNEDNVLIQIFPCNYFFLSVRHQQEISCNNKLWLEW